MYLKSLEMQGFKSFPEKTKLEFGKGMTAIVGPNGAGKSNIADAVRWVLGEQSTKSLRGSKMEDVVFSGTNTRRAQGFAEVTLRLDNSDRQLDKDSDEVAVTRRFYRSGESEYKINGEPVRLRDIHELFMDTGLGRDGYSMVSQGRIEDMVSAKSEDRREMFEEAAGISHFRYRREDAIKRLDRAQENLLRLRDILTELEGRVGPLKHQSEKAKQFLVLSSEKKDLEIGLWLDILERSSQLIREQSNKYEVVNMHYEEVVKELDDIIKSSENISESVRQINIQIDETRRKKTALEEDASSAASLAAVNKNSIEHNLELIKRYEDEKEQENLSVGQISEQISVSESTIAENDRIINEKKSEIDLLAKKINELQVQDSSISDEYVNVSDKIAELTRNLSDERIKAGSASSSIDEIEKRKMSVGDEVENKKEEIEDLTEERSCIDREIKVLTEKISAFTNDVSGYMIKVSSKELEMEQHKFSADKAELDLIQKQDRAKMLREMEKNMDGYQGSVKAVMNAVATGELRGINGTVASLISVPDEYALAIETALGTAIQNIVTDNENSAKKAIYYLRNHNYGRATFLPMTALKGRELNETGLENCAGFISVAADIVDFDQQYEDTVKSLLGKTVIVENIDNAIAMGKKYSHRFRIVTVDGQVINAGGSMTGGSRIQHSGFLSRSNEITRLSREIEANEKKLEEMQQKYNGLKEDYDYTNEALEKAKADLSKAQADKMKAESNMSINESKLHVANDALKTLMDESMSAEARINHFISLRDEAENKVKIFEEEINQEQERLSFISDSRKAFLTEREDINGQISELNLEIVSFVRDIDNLKSHIEELKDRHNTQKDKIDKINFDIQEAKEKNEQLNARINELHTKSDEYRQQIEQAEQQIKNLILQRDLSEKQSNDFRTEERQKTEEKEKLSGDLVRIEEKKNSLLKEHEDTETKLYEEYKLSRRDAMALDIQIGSVAEAKKRLSEIKSKIKVLGDVNVGAVDEYKEVSQRYEFMKTQVEDVEKSKAELNKLIHSLTGRMAVQFRERFDVINKMFQQTFVELFGGGTAELILEDENDILECGIEIKAQPPGKNVKSMSLLSGGEKGLCAIALLLAILKVTPSPFCIFDEVEAALDDVNVLRYARYLKKMTDKTQFILITHRRGTMEESDMLYGVTMHERGVSKLLQLKTAQMAQELGIE